MEQNFIKHINNCFSKLIERKGFRKRNELNDGQLYSVEYLSDTFVIKIEKYRREFYVTLFKDGNMDREVNLFNLLYYLNQESSNVPKSNYFSLEDNLEECYRKQLSYIAAVIYENFEAIDNFFSIKDLDLKFADIEKFMLRKYPNLFNKS